MNMWGSIGVVGTSAVAGCAVLASMLKPPAADAPGWYGALYAAVNFVAINFGHAANATAPGAK